MKPPRHPDQIVGRARVLIGTRFRPQGRSARDGLDCIGVVAVAIGVPDVPSDYALRCGSTDRLVRELAFVGLTQVEDMAAGDVLMLAPGSDQLHLGIFTGAGLVHGDAGL